MTRGPVVTASEGRGGAHRWDTGTGVAGYHWPASSPRAAVLLQHGLSEYAERYVDEYHQLIPHLTARRIEVYAIDLEGHGRSPGRRADTDAECSLAHYRAARAHLASLGRPLFLFGHSLGGLITVASVLESPAGVAGVILSSPALRIDAPRLQVLLIRALAVGCPSLPVGRLDAGGLSRRPDVVDAVLADPLRYHGGIRAGMAASLLRTAEALVPHYPQWTVPVLVLHGTADRYTSAEGSRRFVDAIAASDKTLTLVPGGYHELLNDTAADAVLDGLLGWLEARLPLQMNTPSGVPAG